NKVLRDRIKARGTPAYVCFIRLYSDRLEFLSSEAEVGVTSAGLVRRGAGRSGAPTAEGRRRGDRSTLCGRGWPAGRPPRAGGGRRQWPPQLDCRRPGVLVWPHVARYFRECVIRL